MLGDPKAPVTVTEFLDLQCPICAEASKQTLPTLVNDYVRTGKVKLQARTLHFIGADSARAAHAAAGAQQQGKLWPFVEAFYAAQGAGELGLRDRRLPALRGRRPPARTRPRWSPRTSDAGHGEGRRRGRRSSSVNSTPTFTVTKNGKTTVIGSGVLDAAALQKAALR